MRTVLSTHRCPGCEIRKPLCFCAMIPQLALQTRVIILMHTCEEVLTTNTARLAAKALTNSQIPCGQNPRPRPNGLPRFALEALAR